VALRLRVGLNSGRVIAGEIGSGSLGYKAIGEQVGFAQRMESVAPPGGMMLSESTARLVEHTVMLGEPEWVRIKGRDEPVPARDCGGRLPMPIRRICCCWMICSASPTPRCRCPRSTRMRGGAG
jgi:class 3 adenylate cyclase